MGRNKAELVLSGRTLVARVAQAMEPVTSMIRLIGGDIEGLDLESQMDTRPGLGPLAGIHAALTSAHTDCVLVAACDLPFLTSRLLGALVDLSRDHDAAAPWTAHGPVAVCAAYRKSALPTIEARLDRGQLSAGKCLESMSVRWLSEAELTELDPDGTCLLNVNSPEDFARATAIAASSSSTHTPR